MKGTPAGRSSRGSALAAVVLAFVGPASCRRRQSEPGGEPTAVESTTAPTSPTTTPSASAAPMPIASSTMTPAVGDSGTAFKPSASDAAAPSCRILRGPIELPLRGPATLVVRGDSLEAVLDDDGHPRVVSFPVLPVAASASPSREPAAGGARAGLSTLCAVAANQTFCSDRTGAVHRFTAGEDRIVASSRSGSRVAAGVLAGEHVALAYLASRKTTEGWVTEAWLAVDDEPPRRLSEDGSGATSIAVAPRASSLLALMVDARSALTAMHARTVNYDRGARLGEDVVVFVGGPGDRRTAAALAASASGPSWALLPIGRDVGTFGLATVRLSDPPRVDEPVVWSLYPNGLDPAPVAAAVASGRIWVARVRPQGAEPSAPRVLEVGELGPDGTFSPRDVVPTTAAPSDVALAADARGGLWIAWVDSSGSWVERLLCR